MERPELGLRQLHAFAVLAEELHFGRAAERLGIAQPPLSQQIRRLEERVGHPLFTRGPGGVALTAAGQELLPAARRALDEIADGLDAARRTGSGEVGRLRIGFSASLALTVLPGLLLAYQERYPAVRLELRELTTAPQVAALHEQTIDLGLLREPPEQPGLSTRTILTEELVAVLPAAHPLAAQRAVPVAGLADESFVLLPREAGPTVHDRILRLCREAGFEPRLGQQAVEWQTVAALVGAGLGVSIAPAGLRRLRLPGVTYRRLDPNTARTTVAAAWRTEDRSPLVARFLALVAAHPG
ncbi:MULTISPECIES: LysR family transcriptional regulator [unclassified Kitasatospora]|uniref:LysR family transcriptional regulator n=1 Tax=unclassified Kitasatospora TaxID=2633591 RepID=UPI00070C4867|nr:MULTISPECIES: LysR family transcriptional regulator [unclassified Kitasatospora]KQV19096.1 LysR family transcriptional regulator [Kitasatospora sp. Root107]KRB75652.1 LysR family transcriptional regulator [Kitasatospora sp. Root187]